MASCKNTIGSFECLCKNGYYEKGAACEECQFIDSIIFNVASIDKASGKVTCAAGFTRVGATGTASCPRDSSTGQWMNVGSCQALCSLPTIIDGSVDGTRVMASGSSAQLYLRAVYSCNHGYRLSRGMSNTSIQCSVVDGIADFHSAPTCMGKTCQISAPGNGRTSPVSSTIHVKETVVYSCDDGFRLVGEEEALCDASGTLDSVPPKCQDIVECNTASLHDCHHDAWCVNIDGSYACSCMSGYTGNGTHCKDIDECSDGSLHDCHRNARCTDTVGSYTCHCNTGYEGNGTICRLGDLLASATREKVPPGAGKLQEGHLSSAENLLVTLGWGHLLLLTVSQQFLV
ncbi:signal peptide, CUB and EGF-like domain-containing protein 1 [Sycon ciliatum]|uniref:signal peptide, CUB and EGF-like domain-containing protein 1 n=1 Tax=Sycon ciliatum TaxID=27933 RepID=UPI0031F5FB0D